jgi:hypothetical protein
VAGRRLGQVLSSHYDLANIVVKFIQKQLEERITMAWEVIEVTFNKWEQAAYIIPDFTSIYEQMCSWWCRLDL